ncbi:DUF1149 family protein [Enterococcus casseliflavus]|uniref:DUF1149 family protein n=1 Tax=Enterococcus casseliflavus TaxID=37734 RepID=UPI003D0F8D9C
MELKRQQPIVEAYHFDMKPKDKEMETKLNVGFAPLKVKDEEYMEKNSIIGARLEFQLVFPDYVLSGRVGQVNHILNRKVNSGEDLTKAETDRLVEPLFDIVKRLTYEVTEIVTDKPGLQLNFNANSNAAQEAKEADE